VANHFVVSTGLFRRHRELVPDVHPVTVLTVDALASDFDFDLRDELFSWVVKPAGRELIVRGAHRLVDVG
jgi:hypothetical protein